MKKGRFIFTIDHTSVSSELKKNQVGSKGLFDSIEIVIQWEYKIVQNLVHIHTYIHNNLRSMVSRFKLISLLCMIYMYAMQLTIRKYRRYIFQCLLIGRKACLIVWVSVKYYMEKYERIQWRFNANESVKEINCKLYVLCFWK